MFTVTVHSVLGEVLCHSLMLPELLSAIHLENTIFHPCALTVLSPKQASSKNPLKKKVCVLVYVEEDLD